MHSFDLSYNYTGIIMFLRVNAGAVTSATTTRNRTAPLHNSNEIFFSQCNGIWRVTDILKGCGSIKSWEKKIKHHLFVIYTFSLTLSLTGLK